MWKVIVIICTLSNLCVNMEERPMKHYQNYDECMSIAKSKHKQVIEAFPKYGYTIKKSRYTCEKIPTII